MKSIKLFIVTMAAIPLLVQAAGFRIDFLNLREVLPQTNTLAAHDKVGAIDAWQFINNRALTFSPVIVGVSDTGFDGTHPEFSGLDFGHTPPSVRIDIGLDGSSLSHGTNVVGIIGANNISATSPANYVFPQMNGILSGILGLNYRLEIRRPGGEIHTIFDDISAITDLAQSGSQIINISAAKFDPTLSTLLFFLKIQSNPNILFVVAAGNDDFFAEFFTPANLGDNLNNVITVGGSTLTDSRESSSNFGSAVNIAAPADFVWSPTFFSPPLDIIRDYHFFSGTSASAPLVTGVAAILKSIKPELTPAQIKNILVSTADQIFTDKPIGPRLNALKAVTQLFKPSWLGFSPTGQFPTRPARPAYDPASNRIMTFDGA